MRLTDEEQEEMEHEPMRTDSTGDITAAQPIGGHDADISASTQHHQQAYLNNNSGSGHGHHFLPNLWYQYAAALNYPVLNSAALFGNMGNGTSAAAGSSNMNLVIDGNVYDVAQAKALYTKTKDDLAQVQRALERCKCDLTAAQQTIAYKDRQIVDLKEEVDKLQCVLQQKVGGKPDILASIQEDVSMSGSEGHTRKKQGVSGECSTPSNANTEIQHYKKEFSEKQLIKKALTNNDFLKNIDKNQMHEIVNCMKEETYQQGEYIVREREGGNHFYVSAEGELEVLKNGKIVGNGTMGPGRAFGELAVLYGCTRTASVRAVKPAKVWALERKVFQAIMMRTGLERHNARMEFLRSVPSLRKLGTNELSKVADVLEMDWFEEGEYIVREGQVGDTFYVIADGRVSITQRIVGHDEAQQVRILNKGEYFGERALLTEDRRTANVIALAPGVELLTLNREAFTKHIVNLEVFDKDYGDRQRQAEWIYRKDSQSDSESDLTPATKRISFEEEFKNLTLRDLTFIATLGMGGFGRVELVQMNHNNTRSFALKCLKKNHIVETRQQEHVFSEKKIMLICSSPFIVKLHRTFKDRKFVYMMMEVCLGGELWSLLRDRGSFDDATARFCVACVMEAFQYLHSRGIVYRDLKPENLLVTERGYIKLVDFGFAKYISRGRKTWTFCGTPEYVAPEIILNKGHDHAVDIWAVGVLIYELSTGIPPFTATDPMRTYNIILKGIDALEIPKKVSRNAQSLIKKLCRENPSDRLGYQRNGLLDITKHKWFQGFDWEGLRNLTLQPPFKQKVCSPNDCSNFDRYPTEIESPPDELSGWDENF